jgi:hypothetical protein
MTIELSNLPFKHQGLDDDIDMEALAIQMNAIEPGAGVQETTAQIMPQILNLDSPTLLFITIGIVLVSFLTFVWTKYKPTF